MRYRKRTKWKNLEPIHLSSSKFREFDNTFIVNYAYIGIQLYQFSVFSRDVGCDHQSHYRPSAERTKNRTDLCQKYTCESFHKNLQKTLNSSHPNIYALVEAIKTSKLMRT